MQTDYNLIAERYRTSKEQPWRTFVERFTLLNLIGDPTGLDVIDLACGEGFYTRLLKAGGANRATGVDLSDRMIELAREREKIDQLGIDYVVGDAAKLSASDTYDLAVVAYLLNYASTREELAAMCAGIARTLRPGGRFVAVNTSPALDFTRAPSFRPYGFDVGVRGEWKEGVPIVWTIQLEEGPFEIENYHLDVSAHEDALRRAGFSEVRWHPPRLSPDGLGDHDRAYWSTLLDHCPFAFLECVI